MSELSRFLTLRGDVSPEETKAILREFGSTQGVAVPHNSSGITSSAAPTMNKPPQGGLLRMLSTFN